MRVGPRGYNGRNKDRQAVCAEVFGQVAGERKNMFTVSSASHSG